MKKSLFIPILVLCFQLSSIAQTKKGTYLFSGSTNLSSFSQLTTRIEYDGNDTGDHQKTTSFNLEPSIAYFFIDNLAVGFTMEYSYQNHEGLKENGFIFGPMARYYIGNSKFKPFIQSALGFGRNKTTDDDYEISFNTTGLDLNAGIAVFANKYVSLDLALGYLYMSTTYNEDIDLKIIAEGFSVNFGFSLNL